MHVRKQGYACSQTMAVVQTRTCQSKMKEANDNKNKRLKLTNQVSVGFFFFKSTEKIHKINTSGNQAVYAQKINELVNFVSDCPLFASLNDPRFKYDIGPILEPGAKITLKDGAKF